MSIFQQHTQEEHRKSLADFLPMGKLFEGKNISYTTLFKLLFGLAAECYRVENKMNEIADEQDITTTTLFLEEWEKALGLPDECLNNTTDIDIRRKQVLAKFTLSIDNVQSFIKLASIFGFTVTIQPYSEITVFPLPFPINFCPDLLTAMFTMIVNLPLSLNPYVFPLTFPINFSSGVVNILECFFNHVKPANAQIIFKYVL